MNEVKDELKKTLELIKNEYSGILRCLKAMWIYLKMFWENVKALFKKEKK